MNSHFRPRLRLSCSSSQLVPGVRELDHVELPLCPPNDAAAANAVHLDAVEGCALAHHPLHHFWREAGAQKALAALNEIVIVPRAIFERLCFCSAVEGPEVVAGAEQKLVLRQGRVALLSCAPVGGGDLGAGAQPRGGGFSAGG